MALTVVGDAEVIVVGTEADIGEALSVTSHTVGAEGASTRSLFATTLTRYIGDGGVASRLWLRTNYCVHIFYVGLVVFMIDDASFCSMYIPAMLSLCNRTRLFSI